VPPTFASLGVPAPMLARLDAMGVTEPFPVQSATLPDALAGRDVCGRAPTGSGKTIAFGIPVMARVGKARGRHPRALVLVPTRELATQVRDQLADLGAGSGRSVLAVYGGAGMLRQIQRLHSGADVVVATPGRLKDLIDRGDARLDEVDIVVIDEADRMADMGFLPEVKRLLDQVRPDRQTLLFSATLDGDVDVLIRRYQRDPARHEVVLPVEEAGEVTHRFWRVAQPDRNKLAAEIVRREWPAIVFCRTKHGADRVARNLVRDGIRAQAIHGDLSQGQRERALRAFTSGECEVLVATDVAARGIHVDSVACVVQLDPPATHKDYVHRSGRTGRAGAPGLAITLVTPAQERDVRKMQRELRLDAPITEADLTELGSVRPQPAPAPRDRRSDREPARSGGPRRDRDGSQRPRRPREDHRRGERTAGDGARRSAGKAGSGSGARRAGSKAGSASGARRARRR
jgi:superfamily II DNA/RNA helicase